MVFTLSLGLAAAACVGSQGTPDAGRYQGDDDSDARPFPGFRDGGCPSDTSGTSGTGGPRSTSGTSGGGCDDAGTGGDDDVDDEVDAGPPCDQVTFTYEGEADTVYVTGDFTGWASEPPEVLVMEASGTSWSVTAQIGPGTQEYKFIVDGDWITDPGNPETVSDGYGDDNSVITVCE